MMNFGLKKGKNRMDKPFSKVKDVSYDLKDLHIRWFYDGLLNVSSNCLDRHLEARGNDCYYLGR